MLSQNERHEFTMPLNRKSVLNEKKKERLEEKTQKKNWEKTKNVSWQTLDLKTSINTEKPFQFR